MISRPIEIGFAKGRYAVFRMLCGVLRSGAGWHQDRREDLARAPALRGADVKVRGGAHGPRAKSESHNSLLFGAPHHSFRVRQAGGQTEDHNVCLYRCHIDFRLGLSDRFCDGSGIRVVLG